MTQNKSDRTQYFKSYQPKYRLENKRIESVYPISIYSLIKDAASRLGISVNRFQRAFVLSRIREIPHFEAMIDIRRLCRKLLRQLEPAAGNINQITRKFHEQTNAEPATMHEATRHALARIEATQQNMIEIVYQLENSIPSEI